MAEIGGGGDDRHGLGRPLRYAGNPVERADGRPELAAKRAPVAAGLARRGLVPVSMMGDGRVRMADGGSVGGDRRRVRRRGQNEL